jgi:septal ring factor EnvC (AmiA/AmiB activator)
MGKLKQDVQNNLERQAKDIEELKKQEADRRTEWPKLIAEQTKAFAKASAFTSSTAAPKTKDEEKKERTIVLGNWKDGTLSNKIKKDIEDHMNNEKDDIDEDDGIFSYSQN